MDPQIAQHKRLLAIILIAFPLAVILLARIFGIGSVMWTGCARMNSTKTDPLHRAEAFNTELAAKGYCLDLAEAQWEQKGSEPYELFAPIQSASGSSLVCRMTVSEQDRPTLSLPIILLTIEETVSFKQAAEDSALPVIAETVFSMFTPSYVQNADERYGFGYSYSDLWKAFTDALTRAETRQQLPYFPVPQRKNRALRADGFLIDIRSSGDQTVRTVGWVWV